MVFNKTFLYGPPRADHDDTGGGGTSDTRTGADAEKDKAEGFGEATKRLKGAFKDLGTMMGEYTTRLNEAKGPLEKILEAQLRIRDANEQLVKSGGDFFGAFAPGSKYSNSLQNVIKLSQDFFGNAKAGTEAMVGLATGMRSFVAISSNMQAELGKTVTFMSQLGFSTDQLSKALENQAMAFGTNEKDLSNYAKTMSRVSNTLYIEPTKLLKDFDIVQRDFAYNSKDTLDVFIGLETQARKTGVSFETMASKFGGSMDTFSGVSQIAGRLNSILGTSVFNPLQLLNMNEAERAEAIRAGIQSSPMLAGRDINDLKKFELKSIASSLGMSVLETRKYLTQQGDVRQELEKTIDKRTELAGGKEGLSNLPATNNELARMQDTIRNMRFAAENLTIDAQRLASRATGEMIAGAAGSFLPGGTEALMGREGDLMRIVEQLAGGQLTLEDIQGAKSIDELLQQADKASDRAGTGRIAGTLANIDPRSIKGRVVGSAVAGVQLGKAGMDAIAAMLPGGETNPKFAVIKKVLEAGAAAVPVPGDATFAPAVTALVKGGEGASDAMKSGYETLTGAVEKLFGTEEEKASLTEKAKQNHLDILKAVMLLDPNYAANYIVNSG